MRELPRESMYSRSLAEHTEPVTARLGVTDDTEIPPLTWETVTLPDESTGEPLGSSRLGWGVTARGSLVVVLPDYYAPPDDTAEGVNVLTLVEMACESAVNRAHRAHGVDVLQVNWTIAERERLLARMYAALDPHTVDTAALLTLGVMRWYPLLTARPDLRDLLALYPFAAPLFAGFEGAVLLGELTDPATGRFPRRMPATQLVRRALAAHPNFALTVHASLCVRYGIIPGFTRDVSRTPVPAVIEALIAAGDPVPDAELLRLAEDMAATLPPAFFAMLRGPQDPAVRRAVLPWAMSYLSDRHILGRMLRHARVVTPDHVQRLESVRDWTGLLLLLSNGPQHNLAAIFVTNPGAFWDMALSLLPTPEREGARAALAALPPDPEPYRHSKRPQEPHLWAQGFTRALTLHGEASHHPELVLALERARSVARVGEILRRHQQMALAHERAGRLEIAAAHPAELPRPMWVPASGTLEFSNVADQWVTATWLASPSAVAEEGLTMGHCLGLQSHQDDAASGHSAFFHVQADPTLDDRDAMAPALEARWRSASRRARSCRPTALATRRFLTRST